MKKITTPAVKRYKLQPMPLDPEDILGGNPRAKGEIIFTSKDKKFSLGIWECSAGKFLYAYQEDEICYILEGRAKIKSRSGVLSIKGGDLVIFSKGEETIWNIERKIRKIFLTYEG